MDAHGRGVGGALLVLEARYFLLFLGFFIKIVRKRWISFGKMLSLWVKEKRN
jgi:hypothetical protein